MWRPASRLAAAGFAYSVFSATLLDLHLRRPDGVEPELCAGSEWPLLLSGQSEDKKTCSTQFFRRPSKAQLVI